MHAPNQQRCPFDHALSQAAGNSSAVAAVPNTPGFQNAPAVPQPSAAMAMAGSLYETHILHLNRSAESTASSAE